MERPIFQVLVVSADTGSLEKVGCCLANNSLLIQTATDGWQAMEMLGNYNIGVAVVIGRLTGFTSESLLRRIKIHNFHVEVVMLVNDLSAKGQFGNLRLAFVCLKEPTLRGLLEVIYSAYLVNQQRLKLEKLYESAKARRRRKNGQDQIVCD